MTVWACECERPAGVADRLAELQKLKVCPQRCVKNTAAFFSAEKRSFCLQRSVFFTTIVEFIWRHENPVGIKSASFGQSRLGKHREIYTHDYSDFLANVFK